MTTEKLLTVAVAAYNVEDYLERALSSYCDERLYDALEVIVVNDGSTDSTPEIAQRFVDEHPETFTLITKENGGHGSAVNAALDAAGGAFFRIIDGDDWIDADGMVALLEALAATTVDAVVDVKREVHMVTGETELFELPSNITRHTPLSFVDICNDGDIESYMMLHTMSIRTQLLHEADVHLLENTFYVDYEYIVKATTAIVTIMFEEIEVYQYLVGNVTQSVSAQGYVKRYDDHDRVLKEVLRFERFANCIGPRGSYLYHKCDLMVNTQYNIALIFDTDRKRGYRRATLLRDFLRHYYPAHAKTTERRFRKARALHFAGFDAEKLRKVMGRMH